MQRRRRVRSPSIGRFARTQKLFDRWGLVALAIYLALSGLFFGRSVARHLTSSWVGAGIDQSFFVWCMVWWPHALIHRLNPFVTRLIWAPSGFNLAWSTSVPLLSLVGYPLTATLGPNATLNLMYLACPALAGWTAFLLCRYVAGSFWPALLGGYVFAFSAYMFAHLYGGHLSLVAIFLIPAAVHLALFRLDGRISARRFALSLFALIVAEFMISNEISTTMTLVGAVAIGCAIVQHELKSRVIALLAPAAVAYCCAAVALSPYLYFMLFDFRFRGLLPGRVYAIDLLNLLIPTSSVELGVISAVRTLASGFDDNLAEAGSYLGPALIVVVGWFCVERRRSAEGRFLTLLLLVVLVMAAGPRLHLGGTELFGLPWKILAHFPLFNQIVPGRLFLFVSLIVAVTSAMWLASQERPAWMRLVAAALVAASIMPNLSRSFWKGGSYEPEFFTKALYRSYLKAGETVAFLPYAWGAADDAMAWQAETGMYFRMAGGYFPLVPDSFAQWPIIRAFLQRTEVPDPVGQWKAFIANHDVDVVIFVPGHSGSASFPNLNEILSNSGPPIEVGGVRLCRIPRGELAEYRNLSPLDMEAHLDAQRFAALLRAARAYLAHGGDLSSLSPNRAVQNGLLPAQWMSANSLHSNKPYSNYLWLGPSGNAQVLVGVVGTYRALQPLIDCYRRDARQVFFPYPRLLGSRTVTDATWGSLVMTFDRTGLERAATKSAP